MIRNSEYLGHAFGNGRVTLVPLSIHVSGILQLAAYGVTAEPGRRKRDYTSVFAELTPANGEIGISHIVFE
jgi:hypothetical protein